MHPKLPCGLAPPGSMPGSTAQFRFLWQSRSSLAVFQWHVIHAGGLHNYLVPEV